jgi:hypothetical protein
MRRETSVQGFRKGFVQTTLTKPHVIKCETARVESELTRFTLRLPVHRPREESCSQKRKRLRRYLSELLFEE